MNFHNYATDHNKISKICIQSIKSCSACSSQLTLTRCGAPNANKTASAISIGFNIDPFSLSTPIGATISVSTAPGLIL